MALNSKMHKRKTKALTKKQCLTIYRQLHKKLDSGVAAIDAVESSRKHAPKDSDRILLLITQDLKRGLSFGQACIRRPALFPIPYGHLVQLGDETGKLPEMLQYIVQDTKDRIAVQRRLVQLSVYPLSILAVWILLFPLTEAFFFHSKQKLETGVPSLFDSILVYLSSAFSNLFTLFVTTVVFIVIPTILLKRAPPLRRQRWISNIPLLGSILGKRDMYRILLTLGQGLSAGAPIQRVTELAERGSTNPVLMEKLSNLCSAIGSGSSFLHAAQQQQLFSEEILQAIESGENTGRLDEALLEVADDLREELVSRMTNLSAILSKIILLICAILVVTFVAKQYLSNLQNILMMT